MNRGQERNQRGAKGAETPLLAKSKLQDTINLILFDTIYQETRYNIWWFWSFLCLRDLKLRDLTNLWLKNALYDVIKSTSSKIRRQNDVENFSIFQPLF